MKIVSKNQQPVFERIAHTLRAPVFEDEEKTRIAQIIYVVGIVVGIGLIIEFVLNFVGDNPYAQTLIIGEFVAVFCVLIFTRYGFIKTATIVLLISAIIFATFLMITGHGVRDLSILLFPITLTISGLFLNRKLFFVLTIVSLLSIAIVGSLETYGINVPQRSLIVEWSDITDALILIAVFAMIVSLFTSNLIKSVLRARKNEQHLLEANALLNKQAEELRKSESQWHSLVEHAPDLIMTLDVNGIILFSNLPNAEYRKMMIGTSLFSFVFDENRDAIRQTFNSVLGEKRAHGIDIQMTLQKEVDWYSLRIAPIIEESGIQYVTVIARNITELRSAEEKRQSIEIQLRESQKLEDLGTLAGGIAHDFNNILSIIIGNMSLVKRDNEMEKNNDRIDSVIQAAYRGAGLVKQILTFARKSDIELAFVDVHQTLEELIRMLKGTFPKTIEFKYFPASSLPPILIDSTQLHQALLNLCINARDAMNGYGKLQIATHLVDGDSISQEYPYAKGKRYVQIVVSDTGIGIDEATLKHIFEPFFTTKEFGQGTGLGLSVVYGIVKTHNGIIDVNSELGKGSNFNLYFPVSPQPIMESIITEAKEKIQTTGSEKILLIEDEANLLALEVSALRHDGYEVITAVDGEMALLAYTEYGQDIQLVVTDLDIPKINGGSLCRVFKEVNPNIKMIVTSGYVDQKTRIKLKSLGVKNIVVKPYTMESLLQVIRTTLDS